MEKVVPNLSAAEWAVMKIIWFNRVATANKIIEELRDETDWKPKTIKTLISRLLKKEAISYIPNNREYIYYPIINEKECIQEENKSYLKRVYDGKIMELLLCFLESSKLSCEEIEELRNKLQNKTKSMTDTLDI